MPPTPRDYIPHGGRVGRLEVLGYCPKHEAPPDIPSSYLRASFALRWCVCDCGKTVAVPDVFLRAAKIVSCGCLKLERQNRRAIINTTTRQLRDLRLSIRNAVREYWHAEKTAVDRADKTALDALGLQIDQMRALKRELEEKLARLPEPRVP